MKRKLFVGDFVWFVPYVLPGSSAHRGPCVAIVDRLNNDLVPSLGLILLGEMTSENLAVRYQPQVYYHTDADGEHVWYFMDEAPREEIGRYKEND